MSIISCLLRLVNLIDTQTQSIHINNKPFKMSVDEMDVDVPEVVIDPSEEIRAQFPLLERAVAQFDTRFTLRAIRSISSLRKKLGETKIASLDVKKPVRELLADAEKQ